MVLRLLLLLLRPIQRDAGYDSTKREPVQSIGFHFIQCFLETYFLWGCMTTPLGDIKGIVLVSNNVISRSFSM
jgi:hypothetical protein